MIGALISAGSSLLGGLLGKDSAEDAAKRNAALQREFAQNSLQWKAEDARKAGIHPVYAMGAPTYTPSSVFSGDNSFGAGIASAGQDVGRAIDATRTAPQRLDAVSRTAQALELERGGLQNDLLRAQIAEIQARNMSPPFPSAVDDNFIPGQGNSGVNTKALERIASAHNHPWSEAGPVTDVGFTRTSSGGLAPVYSSDAKQRLEDDWIGMLAWNLRNRLIPSVTFGAYGPHPPGFDKMRDYYNPIRQEFSRYK